MQTLPLKTLLKIKQVQSFAMTAEHLNMTLSAVSMQMKTLEQQLGVSLFDRQFRPPQTDSNGRIGRRTGAGHRGCRAGVA